MTTGPGRLADRSRHPVAHVLARVLGAVVLAMTGLLAFIRISVAAERSGYPLPTAAA